MHSSSVPGNCCGMGMTREFPLPGSIQLLCHQSPAAAETRKPLSNPQMENLHQQLCNLSDRRGISSNIHIDGKFCPRSGSFQLKPYRLPRPRLRKHQPVGSLRSLRRLEVDCSATAWQRGAQAG